MIFSPTDMEEAAQQGARCGHGALAAALGFQVIDALQYLKKGWVNVPMMQKAILAHGRKWERIGRPDDTMTALILVQFKGPWTEPMAHPIAACRYRHWVATKCGLIWDANWPEWQDHAIWKERAPELLPDAATGWGVWGSLRILD